MSIKRHATDAQTEFDNVYKRIRALERLAEVGSIHIVRLKANFTVAGNEDIIDAGYLLCNGQEVNISEYPDLYAKYGFSFGSSNNSTSFKLPNLGVVNSINNVAYGAKI